MSKRRKTSPAKRMMSHPITRLFLDPRIRKYFKESDRKTLELGDLRFILCTAKPKRDKWKARWEKYFPLKDDKTMMEVYKSKQHLYGELNKLRRRYPAIIVKAESGYALYSRVRTSAYKERILRGIEGHSHALLIGETICYGMDANAFDEDDSQYFDRYVSKAMSMVPRLKDAVKSLWLNIKLKEFFKELTQVYGGITERDQGYFIGHAHDHLEWFLKAIDVSTEDYREHFRRLRDFAAEDDPKRWSKAEEYMKSVDEVMRRHGRELNAYLQKEIRDRPPNEKHFKMVLEAIRNLVKDEVISKEEAKWLRAQQRMSRRYSEKMKDVLTSRTLEEAPILVIDTS